MMTGLMRRLAIIALLTTALACESTGVRVASDGGGRGPRIDSGIDSVGTTDSGSGRVTSTPTTTRPNPQTFYDSGMETCGQIPPVSAQPAIATLLFQIDASGSMNCAPASSNPLCSTFPDTDSRWNTFRPNLITAINNLPPETRVGLMYYPERNGCAPTEPWVDIAPVSQNGATITNRLNQGVPQGNTPTQAGLHAAYAVLAGQLDDASAPFVVLATDGQATSCGPMCEDPRCREQGAVDQWLIDEVAAARAQGIRTFVIGVPGSDDFRDVLSQMAEAGGTARCANQGEACHFDLTRNPENFDAALQQALAEIVRAVDIPCEFTIPDNQSGIFDPLQVDIAVLDSAGTVTRIRKDNVDGWSFDDEQNPKRILLNGMACDEVSQLVTGRLTVNFGCAPLL